MMHTVLLTQESHVSRLPNPLRPSPCFPVPANLPVNYLSCIRSYLKSRPPPPTLPARNKAFLFDQLLTTLTCDIHRAQTFVSFNAAIALTHLIASCSNPTSLLSIRSMDRPLHRIAVCHPAHVRTSLDHVVFYLR
ncbi:hypothetical protein CGCF413_v008759 [Colletotrichum fructicola]|nr:hypothetical protein CGCF413_v008759 [Colletotrichum fructicola]